MSLDRALVALQELAETTAAEQHCPSISWGLVSHGQVLHHAAVGTLDDDGTAPTQHTVYRIASMTKSFTAAAVLSVRDDGVFALDDPITRYAPELAIVAPPDRGSAPIRIRDLLSMSGGMATDDPWADRHLDITDQQLDAAIADGVLFVANPGDVYEYSNLGYGLLGRVVKRATGRRVQDLITERLLQPLGMTRSTWVMPDHDDWARPYAARDGVAIADDVPLGDGEIAPMGGIWTTVADLATWAAWLDDATATDAADAPSELLSRSSRREMQQMHRYIGMAQFAGRTIASGYGFGLRVRDDPRIGRVLTHSGGVPGYGSNMRWLAERQFGVIALANITYAPMTDMTQAMLDIVADHDALPPRARPSRTSAATVHVEAIAHRLVALLNRWDDAVADGLFTDNVAMDDPYDRRRATATQWLDQCGGVFDARDIDVEGPASARVAVHHPSGRTLWIDLRICPLLPPRIQEYDFELDESPES